MLNTILSNEIMVFHTMGILCIGVFSGIILGISLVIGVKYR